MIEQIKQALEEIDGTPWRVGTPSPNGLQNVGTKMGVMVCQTFNVEDANLIANAPEWLRYLLGEVERLKGIDERESRIAISIHRKNKELQKALEWYADEANHKDLLFDKFVPYTAMDQDEGERARQALKGSKPK